jgi:beta-lactamase class A
MFKTAGAIAALASALAIAHTMPASATQVRAFPLAIPNATHERGNPLATPHGLFSAVKPHLNGNPIERVQTTPTAYWYYYGVSASQITSYLNANNARIVDLQVDYVAPSGPYFTVSMVANTGVYAKSWWWYYGLNAGQLSSLLTSNNARLISVSPYQVGSQVYFAAVMVSNTGADAKGWWWVYGSPSYVQNTIAGIQNARVVDLENYQYSGSTQYAAIAISNTGADAKAWWWYFGVDAPTVGSLLSQNNAQPLTFVADGSNFDVVMQGCPCNYNWYYYGLNSSQLGAFLAQNGSRPTQIRSYFTGSTRTFDVVMINNANAITSRIGGLMRSVAKGWTGFFLKGVGKSVLGNLNDARVFEPASSIKIVPALFAMRQVEQHQLSLATQVPLLDPNNYCNFAQIGTETAQNAITQMMENSDNARADMFLQRFGLPTLTSFAHSIGMPNTATNAYVDCGPFNNQLTLDDAAHLYENLVLGNYITKPDVSVLFSMMAGKNYDFSGMYAGMQTIVNQEAAPFHLTATQIQTYENGTALSQKSGGYWWPGGVPSYYGDTMYRATGNDGWALLPYCVGTHQKTRGYVFGFFYEEDQANQPNGLVWNQMLAGAETLREQIRAGLKTWSQCGGP